MGKVNSKIGLSVMVSLIPNFQWNLTPFSEQLASNLILLSPILSSVKQGLGTLIHPTKKMIKSM
ncbi:MAG: hypothetical protein SFY56_01995 [Bacteroidota bacterium]|nr:hypothetical protein [Bacteroidota bacterium]